jgi:hypothetical protein
VQDRQEHADERRTEECKDERMHTKDRGDADRGDAKTACHGARVRALLTRLAATVHWALAAGQATECH